MTVTKDGVTKGERTRQALLDAAIRRFAADGYRATSLADLRVGIAALIRTQQASGLVRTDIDPDVISAGLVTSVMALLIAALQTGVSPEGEATAGVLALFEAALKPPGASVSPYRGVTP